MQRRSIKKQKINHIKKKLQDVITFNGQKDCIK